MRWIASRALVGFLAIATLSVAGLLFVGFVEWVRSNGAWTGPAMLVVTILLTSIFVGEVLLGTGKRRVK